MTAKDKSVTEVVTVKAHEEGAIVVDPLDAERNNPRAIQALRERYDVDEELATDMWNRFIDTVARFRERAKATGKN